MSQRFCARGDIEKVNLCVCVCVCVCVHMCICECMCVVQSLISYAIDYCIHTTNNLILPKWQISMGDHLSQPR